MALYSTGNAVKRHDSYIAFDRIFCGQYWDEFALVTMTLNKTNPDILVLGAALGACVRPILAATPAAKISLLDIDEANLDKCRNLYRKHFPKAKLTLIHAAADEFLRSKDRTWDAICVDLYTDQGFCSDVVSQTFWTTIRLRLASDGIAMVNCYGIPMHLGAESMTSPQASVIRSVAHAFPEGMRLMPYRRNLTLLAAKNRHHDFSPSMLQQDRSLRLCDRMFLQTQTLRLPYLGQFEYKAGSDTITSERCWSYADIDAEMRSGWQDFIVTFGQMLQKLGLSQRIDLAVAIDFRKMFADRALCVEILHGMLDQRLPHLEFFPIFIAGEICCVDVDYAWFIDWFIANWHDIQAKAPRVFYLYFLPQILSMIQNVDNRYVRFAFQFQGILNSLKVEAQS